MSSTRGSVARRVLLLVALVAALAVAAWVVLVRKDERIAVGRELVFDDFGFCVEPAGASPLITGLKADGELKLVCLRVSNHARAVDYALDNHAALLVDGEGHVFEPLAKAIQASGTAAPPTSLALGEACVQELYFDVPAGARDVRLKVSWGALGDRLDSLLIGDKSFEIP